MSEVVVKGALVLTLAFVLTNAATSGERFSAGGGNCTFATTADYCNGVGGRTCTTGGEKCGSGTKFNSCEDNTGGKADFCNQVSGCKWVDEYYATTNATGCR